MRWRIDCTQFLADIEELPRICHRDLAGVIAAFSPMLIRSDDIPWPRGKHQPQGWRLRCNRLG